MDSWAGKRERQKEVERLAIVTTQVRDHCYHQSGGGGNGGQGMGMNGTARKGKGSEEMGREAGVRKKLVKSAYRCPRGIL